ncbi:hypothetical protein [Chondrinema litorale]|uniref:hypothetical protein n=1 Tax=Chondrinema litorale TaxID=2994555 RepID=UPI0025428CC8|nr:hypothetical protein [Chondrinema litorale]UZR95263.1 hypothetical protein OQ292_05450 [Chondrinema litorale]
MKIRDSFLFLGGVCSALVSIMHIAIIIGGADWYRFFGAGEEMAQLSEQNAWYPVIVTSFITIVFAIWAMYGFSGAGLIKPLPLLKVGLLTISAIYLLRGLAGIPLVLFADHVYFQELADKMVFMIVSSLICIVFGSLYLIGTIQLWPKLKKSDAEIPA